MIYWLVYYVIHGKLPLVYACSLGFFFFIFFISFFNISQENPPQGKRLAIFGLNTETKERDLFEFFGQWGEVEECQLVYDRQVFFPLHFHMIYCILNTGCFEFCIYILMIK